MTVALVLALCGHLFAAPLRLSPSRPSAPAATAPAPLALAPSAGVYERRGVGLLVVDVKDSTPMHLDLGNRKAHDLVSGALDFAEASVAMFDGVVARRLGDGHLTVFPSFEQALQAAESIQQHLPAALQLRVGVHAGRLLIDASERSLEVYGQPVERALELASISEGGDVVVDRHFENHASVKELGRKTAPSVPNAGQQRPLALTRMTAASTLFVGLADFGPSYERHGRRRAYATIKAFQAYARSIIESHGGLWVKNEGETVMASFHSPADAVRAAADIQSRVEELRLAAPLGHELRVKAGVGYGRALREDRLEGVDFFGNSVNAAARLMRRAEPGEVLVSQRAMAHSDAAPLMVDVPRERVTLKGFSETFSVGRLKPAPAPAPPPDAAVSALRKIARSAAGRVVRAP